MKKILLIGNGGREHALAESLKRSPQKINLYNFANAKNPGLEGLCEEIIIGDILNHKKTIEVAKNINPDFIVIGPDDPIGIGIADTLQEKGFRVFAPTKANAQLESSKSFTRDLLEKYNILGNPDYIVSKNANDTEERHNFYKKRSGEIVVKADGLMGGKGVLVSGDHFQTFEETEDFSKQAIEKFGRVVLEEKFIGQEFSLISLVDGETVLDTPAIQDHKRAFENDEGPNTGGMGCYGDANHSLPFLTDKDLEEAHEITVQTMKALTKENGVRYVGVMYGGFIATKDGVRLIEYNSRFGDPEALNILPILESDFVEVCEKAIDHSLKDIQKLKFKNKATVVKYLCPNGYPTNPVKNVAITKNVEFTPTENQKIFYASVGKENEELILKGSRAIGIVGIGNTIQEALGACNKALDSFQGPLFYRKDIGTKDLIQKRIDHMHELRPKQ